MIILLTNDDGIYAPGLAALEKALCRLGEVYVVAPATEQSGVGHSITFQTPLSVKQVYVYENHWGWAVDGTPADCVKIGVTQICPRKPDLVVSGINSGFNAGINILYSGTVAGAVEGSLYGINSFAVSMQYNEKESYDRAAELACGVIEKTLREKASRENDEPQLFNLNIPLAALQGPARLKTVPMDVNPYWGDFERRISPSGRPYFWLVGRPIPTETKKGSAETKELTDLRALGEGSMTLTPLGFDRTQREELRQMQDWNFDFAEESRPEAESRPAGPGLRTRWHE